MRKATVLFRAILAAMLISSLSFVSVMAAGVEGTEIALINDESGYKIIVPGFIDVRTASLFDEEVNVAVMKTPKMDSNGNYPIFEIVTTDKNADEILSFPGIADEGQIGEYMGVFSEGRLTYAPNLAISSDLKDISKDKIFVFDFIVNDKDGNGIFSVEKLYFMFENNAEAAAPQAEPKAEAPVKTDVVTANPTGSKVVVDGSHIAFEAYEIDGSNYFKLRDIAMAINGSGKQFQVGWDGANNAINLTTNAAYTPDGKELVVSENPTVREAKLTESRIYLNGEEVQLTAYSIGGNNYFKLRDLGKIIDFAVNWDGELNMIGVDTSNSYEE